MPNNTSHIDSGLLRLIASGDERAFRKLFDHYKDRFYYVSLKMTGLEHVAEETVQEVFFKLWKVRESLAAVENPDAYFFTILYRQVYQYYRNVASEKKMKMEFANAPQSANLTDEALLAKESTRLVAEAVAKLPPQQQLIYKLNKIEGLNYNEIADKLNLSPNTVRNHLAAAIRTIRSQLSHFRELAILFGVLADHFSR